MNHRQYITQKILLAMSILLLLAMIILNLTVKTGPEPDAEFPMANQQIEWTYGRNE